MSYFNLLFFSCHLHFQRKQEIVEFTSLIPAWKSETENERKRVRKLERERYSVRAREREREAESKREVDAEGESKREVERKREWDREIDRENVRKTNRGIIPIHR